MRNFVLTLFLAVLVVLTGFTVQRSLLGAVRSGVDQRTTLVAIGGSPIPFPPSGTTSIGGSPIPFPPSGAGESRAR